MGDTAVAVNPKDQRYINLIGKNVEIPLVNRKVKIIADHYADPEQGSGAVKITPAHDFNDYEVGKRNKLELINIFEKNGKINNNGIKKFVGLDRFEARKLLVKQLKESGNLIKIETIKNKVPYGDRSNTIIEPLLTEQWFVNAKKLSKKPISIAVSLIYKIDMLVCNPPYIPMNEMDMLMEDVRLYEPKIALTDGYDGLLFYKRISKLAPTIVKSGGHVILEVGLKQQPALVKDIFSIQSFTDVQIIPDLNGDPRIMKALIN